MSVEFRQKTLGTNQTYLMLLWLIYVLNLLLSKQSKNSIGLKGNFLFTCQPNLTRPNLQIIVTTLLSYTTRATVNEDDIIGW